MDDTALLMGENRYVAEMAKKVMKGLKEEVGEKRPQNCQSLNMERKERARCLLRVISWRTSGNTWSGFENKSQEVGSERKSEEEEVQGEILACQEEQGLPKELHEGQVVATSGYRCQQGRGECIAVGLAPT